MSWLLKKVVELFRWLYRWLCRTKPEPVRGFRITFIQSLENNMERYRASWNPSPSGFVEKHQLIDVVGGTESVLVDGLSSSSFEAFADLTTGTPHELFLRTFGDNGTTADSAHVAFTAKNEQKVAAVEDFGVAWVSHTD